jgi:Rieske Fe-S protein
VQRCFWQVLPVILVRRQLLCGATGLLASGCGTQSPAPNTSCASPANGVGLPYCLVATTKITIPGAAHLTVGEVAIMGLNDNTAAIVVRDGQGLYALSGTCTHQCCTVAICPDDACAAPIVSPNDCAPPKLATPARPAVAFICPCHGSLFGLDGSVLRGPALNPLPTVALKIVGDNAVVDLSEPASPSDRVVPV